MSSFRDATSATERHFAGHVPKYPKLALDLALILGHEHLLLPSSGRLKKMSHE